MQITHNGYFKQIDFYKIGLLIKGSDSDSPYTHFCERMNLFSLIRQI